MAKLKATLEYPDGFGTYDVEADDEAGLQEGIDEIDRQFETHTKAKRNLAELTAAPVDRKRGLFAGADPTTEAPDLHGSGLGAAFEAGGQAWQRGVGRVAGNLAAVPSVMDRALDDVVIPSDGPMEGTSVRQGVPLYAGKRMLDAPQTDGGTAMLSGVADDLRHGLPEMPSGYSQALAKKNLWEKVQDPTWYADMLAGNAPQMGVSLAGGAIGGRPGAAAASGLMMAGDEFQRTQDYEEETGRRAENAGLKALLSGGLQGALDSIVPGSIATGGVKQEFGALLGTVLKEGGTEGLQKLISDAISPAEQRSFGDRMTDPKYLMELAEEGVAGGIMGGAMHPLGQSGVSPKLPPGPTLKDRLKADIQATGRMRPADIIEGRDGTQGMQPVDMVVPERGVSAATAPNPDRAARVVPAGTAVPEGMAATRTADGSLLLYDRDVPGAFGAARRAAEDPAQLEAFLAEHGAKPTMAPFVPRDEPAPRPPKLDGTEDGLYTAALSSYRYATEAIEADPELSPEQKRDALAKRKMAYDARVAELDAKYAPYRAPVEPQPPQSSYFDTIPPEGIRITPQQQRDRERSMIANNSELTPEMKEELLSRLPISVEPTPKQPSYFDTLPPEGVKPTPAVRLAAERSRIMGDATLSPETKEELLSRLPTSVEPQPAQRSYFDTLPPGGIAPTDAERRAYARSRVMGDAALSPEQKEEALARLSAEEAAAAPLGQRSYFDIRAQKDAEAAAVQQAAAEKAEAARIAALPPPPPEPSPLDLALEQGVSPEPARVVPPFAQSLLRGVKPQPKPQEPSVPYEEFADALPSVETAIMRQAIQDLAPAPPPVAAQPRQMKDLIATPKAPAKVPKPAPVAKEAPVAQPVQQPKAAPVSTRVLATVPAPKTAEDVAAENAEREAATTARPMMDRVRETQAKAEAKPVPPPIADIKLAEKHTTKQLKAAEQLVVLAYHSERTAEDSSQKYAAEREVERAERDARAMGVDVDAISRSVGREPTGSDGNARPTVAKVVPESAEVTPQVTAETSPFMRARRAAEVAAAKEATPEPKKKASKSRVSAEVEANMLGDVEDAAAGNGNQFQDAAGRLATSERKARTVGINDSAIAAARARGEAKATGKTKKTPKPDTPKTVEKKLAAAVAKEKALRAKRDADPENEALLDEYNEATAELYALTKEANGKGVSTLAVTTDDDTPSLMKTIPQREARTEAFGDKPVMTREAFDKALEDAKKRLPGIAHLVDALNSQADLPASVAAVANGDRIDGFTQNGRVAVVADGMTSPEHVAATLAHEAVGHLVPEAVFGKNEWRKRLNDMMASSQWFRDFVANFGKSEIGSRYKAAELASEAVAFEANRVLDDANYKPPNAYRMFIAKLREWLREAVGARRVIGLNKVLEFSDRDLAAFIARSKRTAETGLPKNRRKGDGKPSFAKGPSTGYVELAQAARTDTGSESDPFQLDTINEWLTVDRAKAALADPLSLARGVRDAVKNPRLAYEAVHRKMADRFYIFDKAEKEAKKRGATGDISMYRAEDERHGKTATEIEDMNSQFVDPIIKIANENDVSLDDIGEWLYASHAYRRNAEGRKRDPKNDAFSGMTDVEADAILDRLKGKSKALDEIAERVYSMLDYERKRIVEAGLATKEEVDGWAKTWGPFYVPLKHQEADAVRSGNASGFSALKKVTKSATGRYTLADNPLTSAVSQVERTIKRAHDAEVGRELLRFFEANPNPELWVVNPKPKKKTLKTTKDEDGNFETTVKEVAEPTFLRDDILNVKVNGENVEVQIKHPDMLRAAKRAFENEQSGEFIKAIGEFSRLYGGLLTMYNMEFWLTNPIRDVQTAAANMSIGYGKDKAGKSQMVKTAAKVAGNFGKAARGVVRFMRDPNSNDEYAVLYKQMRKEGATVGWSPFEDPKAVEKRLSANMNAIKRGGMDPRTWATKAAKLVHDVNTVAETATRLSVYKMLGDAGITGRERVQIVKNSTVNFNRKGEAGPLFNSLYLFGNVGIQGPVAMAKFAARNKKAAAGVAGSLFAVGMAQTFLNQMFAGDDDDDGYSNYDEMQESTKARNWIIGKSSVPMGHGWSFFVNAGRYTAETLSGKKTPAEAAIATATNFIDSFNPMGTSGSFVQALTPTIGDPFVQHAENRTAFESPIYPTPTGVPGDSLKPDSQRYFRSAPQWAVKTAEKLNELGGGDRFTKGKFGTDISPETLQFASDWATQGLPKLLMRMASFAGNTLSGEKTRTGDIPFVRRFRTDEHPSLDRGRYIRQRDELEWKFRAAKAYKDGPGKDLAKYDALLSGPLRSRSDFNSIQKLYARLDDVEQTPAVEALKDRLIGVASRQFEIAKKPVKYSPLDTGLLDSLDEAVEAVAPKQERESTNEEILEDLEGR